VEFGLEFTAEAGASIAAASSANLKVILCWSRPPTTATSADVADGG
jgi:hypothetical protein